MQRQDTGGRIETGVHSSAGPRSFRPLPEGEGWGEGESQALYHSS